MNETGSGSDTLTFGAPPCEACGGTTRWGVWWQGRWHDDCDTCHLEARLEGFL